MSWLVTFLLALCGVDTPEECARVASLVPADQCVEATGESEAPAKPSWQISNGF